jgi:hypothetical protein
VNCYNCEINVTGFNTASYGAYVYSGTLNLFGGKITTSGGGTNKDLYRDAGTINVSADVNYDVTKTTGTINIIGNAATLENIDLGTLTDTNVCKYDLAGTEIDCNLTTDGSGDCGSGAVCLGDHTHSSYLNWVADTYGINYLASDTSKRVGLGVASTSNTQLKISGSVNAATYAYGVNLISTLNATQNNDILYGVFISPDYVDGIYTGVTHAPLTVVGNVAATTFTGALTGNASTASALAADGSNCSATSSGTAYVAGGVTAAGVAEACTQLDGRSLTVETSLLSADAELYTDSIGFNLENPTTGDNGKFMTYFPLASTITKIYCSVDSGTVTINGNERALATPDTTGTDVLSAGLVCDTDTQTSCASGCDVNTITNAGIDVTDPLALEIDATSGNPTILRVTVVFTRDD